MPTDKISLFIPSYNAENTLESVVKRIPQHTWDLLQNVYLIDDGSNDGTAGVIQRITEMDARCIPVFQHHNRGYGETVKHGLRLCKNDGCNFAVCLHADGQYPPEKILEGINTMKSCGAEILQGSRIASGNALQGGMPLYKYIAGKTLNLLENWVFRLTLTDYHSGFLLYSKDALDRIVFDNLSSSFDFDLEVIASARAGGMRVTEMPIPTRYADEVSYLNPITYGFRVLRVLGRYLFRKYHRKVVKKV